MENEIEYIYKELFENNKNILDQILIEYQKALDKKEEYELGFNVFSLVSDTYYKENLHSSILKEILDHNGKHKEKDLYLKLFIEYLNEQFNCEINYENYIDATVSNETDGRIDLIIKSNSHCIIIENKINDASDMENQVLRYYLKFKNKKIDSILYLTKEGKRIPKYEEWTHKYNEKNICAKEELNSHKEKIIKILKPIACFDINDSKDLCNGWLDQCIEKSKKEDNKFILKQYKQLLKHLRQYIMEYNSHEEFYKYLFDNNLGKKITLLCELNNQLIYYYPELIKESLNKKIINEIQILESNKLKILKIWETTNYYLQIDFEKDNLICIYIMDDSNKWQLDENFRNNNKLKNAGFTEYEFRGVEYWEYKQNINLTDKDELNNFIEKVIFIINIK